MSIYQRGKNLLYRFHFQGAEGPGDIGPSKKNAQKVIDKKKTEIVENKYLDIRKDPDPIKFHEFAKEYLAWSRANKKPVSAKDDLYRLRKLDEEFSATFIHDITAWKIEKYKSRRIKEVGPATVNSELRLLKHIFTKAIEWKKAKENPAKTVKLFKGERQRDKFLSLDEIGRLTSKCCEWLRPIVITALHTGMRKEELISLKWEHVDLERGIIAILDSKNRDPVAHVPMDETLKAAFKEFPRHGEYVFSREDSKRRISIQDAWESARKEAEITGFTFHGLRHTFASYLVMLGKDLKTVMELMRVKSVSMVMRYAHLAPEQKRQAVNDLDKLWSQNPPQEEKREAKVVNLKRETI